MTGSGPMPRIAVIGVGAFGREHVKAYRRAGVDLVGVADSDIDRARAIAAEFDIPYVCDSGFRLIDDLEPAAVSVVTNADAHLPLALHAARQGCYVLLEKPVATTASDAFEITDAAEGRILPGHVLRFEPVHRRLRELVANGEIGTVLAISASRSRARWHVARYPDIHPALLTGVHDIDLAVWLAGSRAISVSANAVSTTGRALPDIVFGQVTAADGSIWSIRTAWTLLDDEGPLDVLEVFGSRGLATIRVDANGTSLAFPSPADVLLTRQPEQSPGLTEEIDYFLDLVREGRRPAAVTMSEAGHVVAVAEAMIASADNFGQPIRLDGYGKLPGSAPARHSETP